MTKKILILLFLCVTSALHAANYLTFTAEEGSSAFGIKTQRINYSNDPLLKSDIPNVQYSLNGGKTWKALPNDTLIRLKRKGDKAMLKGMNPEGFSNKLIYTMFIMEGSIAASGSVMSLIDEKGESLAIPGEYCFSRLFEECSSLTQAPQLPAKKLAVQCYSHMFIGCTSLTQAPQLPAKKLAVECYLHMFSWCTSLTQAPKLPATKLADYCYARMFSCCTNLAQAPQLPATTLEEACYGEMFNRCTSLKQAPKLPATEMKTECYAWMFNGCDSLAQAPELPATALAKACYAGMFRGCTSLTQAPQLPATALAKACYEEMFRGCIKLSEIKVGFTDWGTEYEYYGKKRSDTHIWLSDVAPNGTFICPKELPKESGENRIPEGWEIIKK